MILKWIAFIDEEGCVAKSMDGKPIDTLWACPGDKVIWINIAQKTMTVEFEDNSLFGIGELKIPPGNRSFTTVHKDAHGSFEYRISPCTQQAGLSKVHIMNGAPKSKVGDDP